MKALMWFLGGIGVGIALVLAAWAVLLWALSGWGKK